MCLRFKKLTLGVSDVAVSTHAVDGEVVGLPFASGHAALFAESSQQADNFARTACCMHLRRMLMVTFSGWGAEQGSKACFT